jgi:hypothetical protein
MLTLPTILLGFKGKHLQLSLATSGLTLVLCVSLIDLVPNATISPLTWLIAGSMMGRFQTASTRSESEVQAQTASASGAEPAPNPKVVYRRSLGKYRATRQK